MNYTPEYLAARGAAVARNDGWGGHDAFESHAPAGHRYGLEVSSRLTSDYRQRYRKGAMDINPQDVVSCLVEAGVRDWVLMGLHGYAGYLPQPRATQDVDVMVPYSQKKRAVKAILRRWPTLEQVELPQVIRFFDPGDRDAKGQARPVVDLMLPWSPFQKSILKSHVIVDSETANRIPTVDAAIVSKYAAMISPNRERDRKEQDAVDLRRMIKANRDHLNRNTLSRLATQVWERGGEEILEFLELANQDKPFPI